MPSKEQILKAEAVHFLLRRLDEEFDDESKVVFITIDLFKNFVTNIHYSKHIKSIMLSNMQDLSKHKFEIGDCGLINTIEFHIIAGNDTMYAGTNLCVERYVEAIVQIEEEL